MKHKAIQLDPRKLIVSEQYQARKTASQTPLPQLADSIAVGSIGGCNSLS